MNLENVKRLPEKYCVGDNNIDKHHAVIIYLLNKVVKRKKSFKAKPALEIDDILLELSNYARTHFAFEEQLLKKAKYPQLKEHLQLHAIFTKNTKQAFLSKDHEETIKKLAGFLRDWFLNHINDMDRDAIAYVNRVKKITDDSLRK